MFRDRSNPVCSAFAAVFFLGICAGPSSGAGVPAGVDMLGLRAVLHEDVRVLWLGDSYAEPFDERPSGSMLISWRIDNWSAFALGDGPDWFIVKYSELVPSIQTIDASNSYRIFQTGPDAEVRYALPTWRMREVYRTASASPIDVLGYRVENNKVAAGFHGPFVGPGDGVGVRPLFLEPPGSPAMLPGVTISPAGGAPAWFDPRTSSRPKRLEGFDPGLDPPTPPADGQIFASPMDIPMTANASGELIYTLSVDASTPGYLMPAGFVAYRTTGGQREPGLYFSVLSDSSWAYEGFGLDTPSGTAGAPVKTFSREQLAHWLDATTIDPAQPVYAFYLLNVEDITPAEAAVFMEAMVDQTAGAAADAGLGPVHHCIVIPWNHRIDGQVIPGRHEEQRDAAYALAASRPDVSAISIFDATDGVVFDWNTPARQWLAAHGYDNFTYGDITVDLVADGGGANGGLLDVFRSHPGSPEAGAFFAHIIEKTIVDACPADFAPPWGVLDLSDLSGFLTRFLDQKPSADLADPVGSFDLADIQAFVASFVAGCGSN